MRFTHRSSVYKYIYFLFSLHVLRFHRTVYVDLHRISIRSQRSWRASMISAVAVRLSWFRRCSGCKPRLIRSWHNHRPLAARSVWRNECRKWWMPLVDLRSLCCCCCCRWPLCSVAAAAAYILTTVQLTCVKTEDCQRWSSVKTLQPTVEWRPHTADRFHRV